MSIVDYLVTLQFTIGDHARGEEVKRLMILCALLMMTVSGTIEAADIKSPTGNVLGRLLWLGDTANRPQGSGTLISDDEVEYLVTAFHVFRSCNGNPSVRFRKQWNPIQWDVVAKDEDLDVIVLKSAQLPADLGERLPVLYGVPQGAIHGQIGYSLGFPAVIESRDKLRTDHVLEHEGRPIPIAALVLVNLSAEIKRSTTALRISMRGFPEARSCITSQDRTCGLFAGIITGFPFFPRPVYDGNGERPDTSRISIPDWLVMCRCLLLCGPGKPDRLLRCIPRDE